MKVNHWFHFPQLNWIGFPGHSRMSQQLSKCFYTGCFHPLINNFVGYTVLKLSQARLAKQFENFQQDILVSKCSQEIPLFSCHAKIWGNLKWHHAEKMQANLDQTSHVKLIMICDTWIQWTLGKQVRKTNKPAFIPHGNCIPTPPVSSLHTTNTIFMRNYLRHP